MDNFWFAHCERSRELRSLENKITMNIIKSDIEGVLIIEPCLFRDARGYFFESFSEREFEEKVTPILGTVFTFAKTMSL